jgi:hypothetical protein
LFTNSIKIGDHVKLSGKHSEVIYKVLDLAGDDLGSYARVTPVKEDLDGGYPPPEPDMWYGTESLLVVKRPHNSEEPDIVY